MSLRDLIRPPAGGPPAPAPTPPAVVMPPPQLPVARAPDRQLGTQLPGAEDDVVPMRWPDDPACAHGNQLAVMIDEENRGWIGLLLADGRFLYLLGPLPSIDIPF